MNRPAAAGIEVENLAMTYGAHDVLIDVSFRVDPGEVFALLGPNGAGKTTTVEILEGYRNRTGGRASVLGLDPERAGRRLRERIGIVLQSTAIEAELTVMEAARLHAGYHRRPLAPGDALELVGMAEQRKAKVANLSGGQRRRLDLALAIVGRPEVLFLDEPTTGFDPEARREAWRLIEQLRSEGTTVLLTTHYLDEAETLADRVGILLDGRLAALGAPSTLTGGDASVVTFRSDHATSWTEVLPEAKVVRDRVTVTGDDALRLVHRVTATALERNWSLGGLEVRRPNLEDLYLSMLDGAKSA